MLVININTLSSSIEIQRGNAAAVIGTVENSKEKRVDGPVFIVLSLFDFLLLFFRRPVGQGRQFVFIHFQGGFEFGDPLDLSFYLT